MKRLYLFAIAALFALQSCTVMKDVTTTTRQATYSVSLDKVELPSNSKERFSETIQKENSDQGVTKYVFEDENIRIFWLVLDKQFSFTIYNKTNHALKINWDDVVYVNTDKNISKMIHSGIKYSKMNEGQVSTTLPKGAKLEDILVPVDNIHLISNEWTTLPLFPNWFSSDEAMEKAKTLEGESVSILLPIKIEDVQNDYTFSFKIDKVEVNSTTTTRQEHDYDAEFTRTMNATLWGTLGGIGLIVLIALAAI
ncbi:MAG: hypothetical protein IJ524_05440 [Bacteroidales bacterium]|nr:hypothetical protein [Bacteroidales bacterium]